MKLSETWLREWANPPLSTAQLAEQLTMAGLEVEGIFPAAEESDDHVFEIKLTPNRGDCLSVLGVAREIAGINHLAIPKLPDVQIKPQDSTKFPIQVAAKSSCPRYVGRVITGINPNAVTPIIIQERLRCSGIHCINPVVDVVNYVMLELGQPMHAFDLQKLSGSIQVRNASRDETLELLDNRTVTLTQDTLVIADDKGPQAIAGIMGGLNSAVTDKTQDIFLESAFFNPLAIAGKARIYNLVTDSSQRFERGVDPALTMRAAERATELLLSIVGGKPGPIIEVQQASELPKTVTIPLRLKRIHQVLGVELPSKTITTLLQRLGLDATEKKRKLGSENTQFSF